MSNIIKCQNFLSFQRGFSQTTCYNFIQKECRCRVVDNSKIGAEAASVGRKIRCIQVYGKKKFGGTGDKILVTIMGEMKKAYIIGCKGHPLKQQALKPRFDSTNVVILDEQGNPLGTRITAPVPSWLRGKTGNFTKIIAIAGRFV